MEAHLKGCNGRLTASPISRAGILRGLGVTVATATAAEEAEAFQRIDGPEDRGVGI